MRMAGGHGRAAPRRRLRPHVPCSGARALGGINYLFPLLLPVPPAETWDAMDRATQK